MFKPKDNLTELSSVQLLNYFEQLIDRLALKYGYNYIFDDFLDCCINGLSFNYSKEIMKQIQGKYNQEERYVFGEMLKIWIAVMNHQITDDNQYYDFFGNQYEKLAMSKKHGFAQYFTPEVICTFMAQIVYTTNPSDDLRTIAEPACGSGRLNLAMHSIDHKLFHYANDLDLTCAKMTALNFAIHGVKGIVTCDDGLFPFTKFRGAFLVNYKTAPYIEYFDNQHSTKHFLDYFLPKSTKIEVKNDIPNHIKDKIDNTKEVMLSKLGQQLSMF